MRCAKTDADRSRHKLSEMGLEHVRVECFLDDESGVNLMYQSRLHQRGRWLGLDSEVIYLWEWQAT